MRRFLSILLALGLVLSFSLLTAVPALAASEVWVDDFTDPSEDGSIDHPFDSIQEGIDYAFLDPEGGIVHVLDGYYNEDITLKDGVAVLGAGASDTTIDGTGSGPAVTADNVGPGTALDGFTVTGGVSSVGGGMYIFDAATPMVSNCIFFNNHADLFGGGMYILDGSSPTVANCIFEGNTVIIFGGGICCWDSISSTIINNTIVNNTANQGGGIYANPGSSPNIINNIIVDNTASSGGGIYSDTAAAYINYNDVWHNTGGDYGGLAAAGTDDKSLDPVFYDAQYHITYPGSPCIDAGNNTAVPADTADLDDDGNTTEPIPYDLEGDPRIWGDVAIPVVDMGADEYSDNQPPDAPDISSTPLALRNGSSTDDNTPEFSFIQNDPNDWDTVKYTFQIDDDPLFGSPAVDYTSVLLDQDILEVFTSPSLPDGEYYWQVRSTDRYDAEGPWADGSLTPGEPAFRLDTSPAGGGTVGGTVYPIDKAALLLPWLGLSIIMILAAGGLIIIRRQAN